MNMLPCHTPDDDDRVCSLYKILAFRDKSKILSDLADKIFFFFYFQRETKKVNNLC